MLLKRLNKNLFVAVVVTINRFPHFYNKGLMSITKSKNGFADYPSIPKMGLHEPMRTLRIQSLLSRQRGYVGPPLAEDGHRGRWLNLTGQRWIYVGFWCASHR